MSLRFTNAIVRPPSASIADGISSVSLGKPDYQLALKQHANYVQTLKNLGLNVVELPALNDFPDSTFVEDVALCAPKCGILTNPGAASRNAEKLEMETPLRSFYETVEKITEGTVDAGDIMMVGNHFYIGISARSDEAGANNMISILEKHGLTGSSVPLKDMLHLKTGLSYLENNVLLVSGEFINHSTFQSFDTIVVEEDEAYGANSLWINGTVLVPAHCTKTLANIEAKGYPTIALEMTEFEKIDGGLSCLSLRF
jgi:dimethylargininase